MELRIVRRVTRLTVREVEEADTAYLHDRSYWLRARGGSSDTTLEKASDVDDRAAVARPRRQTSGRGHRGDQ
jgi:hypothetical protein